MDTVNAPTRANTYEEIRPLLELCKRGKLFAVQEWIAEGKPVNPPPFPGKGRRGKTPLEIAIEHGFHSLVEVLLKGGAVLEPLHGYDSIMVQALNARRSDIVQLLVEHGYDAKSVDMTDVFESWDAELMEYFIERGAEVEAGRPFAYAFSARIRTAIGVYKKYKDRFPSLPEQANIALRHHCKEGNLKWVSLMLWLGADPYAPGAVDFNEEREEGDEGCSALTFAALYDHFAVFGLRQIKLDPTNSALHETVRYLAKDEGVDVLKRLLENGFNPNDQENGGCSTIQNLLQSMSWYFAVTYFGVERKKKNIDTSEARDKLRALHLLAKHGGKWRPESPRAITEARQSLLKMTLDYTVEFAWIMSKYRACTHEDLKALLSGPKMKAHVAPMSRRIAELLNALSTTAVEPTAT